MSTSKIYDLNRYRKTYPLIRRKPVVRYLSESATGDVEVEVATINFDNVDTGSYDFTKTYTSIPVCVITPEDDNVNVYITSLSKTSITVTSSFPFLGKVHLHIYPDDGS